MFHNLTLLEIKRYSLSENSEVRQLANELFKSREEIEKLEEEISSLKYDLREAKNRPWHDI